MRSGALLALRRSCPPSPTTPHCQGEFRPLSCYVCYPWPAVRNTASACGMVPETGRFLGLDWAGLGWTALHLGGHHHWGKLRAARQLAAQTPPASCRPAWPYLTLITEPCPAHHLGPVPARHHKQALDAARLLQRCFYSVQTGQFCPMGDRALPSLCLSTQPLPPKHMFCAALSDFALPLRCQAARASC